MDNVNGKVTDERYEKVSAKFEAKQAALILAHDALEAKISRQEEAVEGVDRFLDTVRRYTEIEKLTPAISMSLLTKLSFMSRNKRGATTAKRWGLSTTE